MRLDFLRSLAYFTLVWTAFLAVSDVKGSEVTAEVTRVVLIGATGDLARKYLWQGLFNLYHEHDRPGRQLKVYAAARIEPNTGLKQVQEMLKTSLKCAKKSDFCETKMTEFVSQVTYHKLKRDDDYKEFCEGLYQEGAAKERGRILYLSVPPSAYGAIAKSIHFHCRPNKGFLRVVFEKPFGKDLDSAKKLAGAVAEYFKEDEMYRIDHYLGKTGVQQVLKFRYEMQEQFESSWNRDYIERVEIVLKERDDCKGRTQFYNQYGVIRDVMQNHMTELMAMVAMELPSSLTNLTDIHKNKLKVLKGIMPPSPYSTVIGQYSDYEKHCTEEKCTTGGDALAPTFAAAKLYVNNVRWQNVPFIFISGKQLDERAAYVRVIFRNNKHSVKAPESCKCSTSHVVFHIQGGTLGMPALVVSKTLSGISKFLDWNSMKAKPEVVHNCHGDDLNIFTPSTNPDAYSVLIKGVYNGHHDMFIGTEDLLTSWKVWTPLLQSLENAVPRLYDNISLEVLDFTTKGKVMEFTNKGSIGDGNKEDIKLLQFRGQPLITGSLDTVVESLAAKILKHALDTVAQQGSFHLALSGGSSPLPLYQQLAFHTPTFPWHATHVWIVDERCVPFTDLTSNFHSVHQNLLQYVSIPFWNTHPMPVYLQGGLCKEGDSGPELYEKELKRHIKKEKLDFVLLGVGSDGHTASLFPNSPWLDESTRMVTLSESKEMYPKGLRMTLTLHSLNQAKSIAVLVHGRKKAGIVAQIADIKNSAALPIMLVHPVGGELVWYIDDSAMDTQAAHATHSEL